MAQRKLSEVVRYLQRLTRARSASGLSDAELLERYVRHRDEAAFELLLWRHGVLVLNVCRRVLHREQDAEDAFQATFLAFVRKADAIARRGSVSSWLYKVAYRIALEARARAQKNAMREQDGGESLASQPSSDPVWSDVRPILDEEVNRLPERLRRPFVLCYLEGKTNEEAARQLGCRLGTVFSRLSRGRELLRNRLLRRGVTLSTAALTAALAEHAAAAVPIPILVQAAVRAALSFAGVSANSGISSRVTTLAEGVLRSMFVTKIKTAALMLFVVGLLAAGGVFAQHALRAAPQAEVKAEDPATKREAPDKPDAKPVSVRVVKPTPGGLARTTQGIGEVIAAQQQQIVPLISGTIKEVSVDIGDHVKKGQVLIVLDAPLIEKEQQQATAALEMAQAQMEEAQANVAAAEAEAVAAKSKPFKLEHARAVLKTAKANIRVKQALVDKAQIEKEFTRITAAFDGVVTRRTADPGNFVQSSDSRLLSPLLTLMRMDRVRVVVEVPESFATLTQRGDPVDLSIKSLNRRDKQSGRPTPPGDPHDLITGQKIARFSPILQASNGPLNLANAMRVEIDVENPKMRLLPGMNLGATIHFNKTRSPKSFLVPSSCLVVQDGKVLIQGDKAFLYVVREGKAHRTAIKVVYPVPEDNTEIVEGVNASDLIVTDPKNLKGDVVPVEIQKGR